MPTNDPAYMRVWRAAHRDSQLAKYRAYYQEHREHLVAYARERRVVSRESERVRYKKDPTKKLRSVAAWRERNSELRAERQRAYYAANAERLREWARQWRDAHPDLVVAGLNRRRERVAAGGDFTGKEWLALLRDFKRTCAYCGATGVKLVADHRIPLSRGGSNLIENIWPACAPCNGSKHVMTDDEFRASPNRRLGSLRAAERSSASPA